MNMKQPLLAVGLLLGAASINANAALTSFIGAGNVGLVYSSLGNITWTQDGNLFKTLYDTDNDLVNQIVSLTPIYNDTAKGERMIAAGDFNIEDGRMTWWGANAFVNYLNSISYGGSDLWRLPSAGSNPHVGYLQTSNELGQLFYNELGGVANRPIPDSSYFINEQASVYWSGTEFTRDPNSVWYFLTNLGYQLTSSKSNQLFVWAVSPGQVPEVPLPGAVWLMGSGLLGLLGLKRRLKAG
ncbi:MAG TPA: PEP-CTERM sorting domain-containing protein [Methylococcaceae bacterium]|nr:PEP-CTERM sorting domain-containing protein [Methylococcaceae bacterium]